MSNKRICIDLDGVIADFKKGNETYADVNVIEGAKEKLSELKQNNFYIIIQTARHMKTCEGNVGLVNAKITKITLEWLEKHQIPFDEIYFGKPWAHIYIDDNAFRFEKWNTIASDGSSFPKNNESHKKEL
jgi:capsule biosynthesis phosphatase